MDYVIIIEYVFLFYYCCTRGVCWYTTLQKIIICYFCDSVLGSLDLFLYFDQWNGLVLASHGSQWSSCFELLLYCVRLQLALGCSAVLEGRSRCSPDRVREWMNLPTHLFNYCGPLLRSSLSYDVFFRTFTYFLGDGPCSEKYFSQ